MAFSVKDLQKLMQSMKANGIAHLDFEGLKLTLMPEAKPAPTMTSGFMQTAQRNPTVQQAFAQVDQARVKAAEQRRQKLDEVRAAATSAGITLGTASLVKDIYETTIKTSAPKPIQSE